MIDEFEYRDEGDHILSETRPPQELLWTKVTRRVGDELDKDKTLLRMSPMAYYILLSKISKEANGNSEILQAIANLRSAVSDLSRHHVSDEELKKLV